MTVSSTQQLPLTSANNGQPPDIDSALRQIFLASSGHLVSSGSNNVMTSQQLFTNADNRKIAKIQSQIYQFFEEPYQSGELMTGAMINPYTQASSNGIPEAASKAMKRDSNRLQSYIVSIGNSLIKNYQKKGVKTSNLAHFRTPLYEYLSMSTGLANTVERRTMVVTYLGLSGLGRMMDLTGDDKVDYKDITQAWRISYQAPQRSPLTSPAQTVQNNSVPPPSTNISTVTTQAAQNDPPPPPVNAPVTQTVQNNPPPPVVSTAVTQTAQNDPPPPPINAPVTQTVQNNSVPPPVVNAPVTQTVQNNPVPPPSTNISTVTTQAAQNDPPPPAVNAPVTQAMQNNPPPPVVSTAVTQTAQNRTTTTASQSTVATQTIQNNVTPTIIKGDINFDGKVDNADLRLLKEALKGQIILSSQQIMAADLDFDGLITKKDKKLLRKMIRNR